MDEKKVKVVDTDNKKGIKENRCPKCNASDVTLDIKKGKLVCNYCGNVFDLEEVKGIEKEAKDVIGEVHGSGTKDIKDMDEVITIRCGGCGAEVVINASEAPNARCHWCRSILSINSQVDNGIVPDEVLPFKIEKDDAMNKIAEFVEERKFYAHPKFKEQFKKDNIMGVYFPYLLVDCNAHAKFTGEGGHVARTYTITVGSGDDKKEETVYDIDIHDVVRDFDITIDDLQIESSKDKLNKNRKDKTTNIINAIMPFDTENCTKYEANYLVGFSSEKRDINVSDINDKINQSLVDIARHAINVDLKYYDSGVHWDDEELNIKGKQIVSAYLPVWLYSYQAENGVLHYVAVNARTGETMGSIPINTTKLYLIAGLIELIVIAITMLVFFLTNASATLLLLILLIIGPIFLGSMNSKYRNIGARHKYELETKSHITILSRKDELVDTKHEQSFRHLTNANNERIVGEYTDVRKEEQK